MQLSNYLDARNIFTVQKILTREQVYRLLVEAVCQHRKMHVSAAELLELIERRDQESATAYPSGIAIPHIRLEEFQDTEIAMAFLQNPIEINGIKVGWVVLIITDKSSSKLYLNLVAALLALSREKELLRQLSYAADGSAVLHLLKLRKVEVKGDLTIADIMVKDPVSIGPGATLREFSDLLNDREISVLPVTDASGAFLGEVDILTFLQVGVPEYLMMIDNLGFLLSFEPLEHLFEKLDVVKVGEIMRRDQPTVGPQASIIEAVSLMIKERKRYLAVVDGGHLVGVVTAMDVFRKVIQA